MTVSPAGPGTSSSSQGALPPEIGPQARTHFWSIQYLRLFATFAVVLGHFLLVGAHPKGVFAGVDIFFVISGFLVWVLTAHRSIGPLSFMFNRITRIAPLYWIITTGLFLLARSRPWLTVAAPTTRHFILSMLFVPHLNSLGHNFPLVGQGWTLVYDMYFYFLFSLTLAVPRPYRLRLLTGAFLAAPLIGFVMHPSSIALQTYTSPAMLGFLGGVWIGELWLRRRLPPWRWAAPVGLLSVGAYGLLLRCGAPYTDGYILLWSASACGVALAALSLEASGWRPKPSPLEGVGNWTYGIYLVHALILTLVFLKVPNLPFLRLILIVTLSCLAGMLLWRFVERPLNSFFRQIERRHAARMGRPVAETDIVVVSDIGP